jgi:TolB-like protein/DNA-binding winged helix-turn-helix (wHTH) protein
MNASTEAGRDAQPVGYSVGDLTIDLGRQSVMRGDHPLSMPGLSFDLLLALVRAAPNLVSFDQLMERVWPGLIVNPETVTQRIKLVRDALGDDPHEPRYIAGLRGRGYRLLPAVAVIRAPEYGTVLPNLTPLAAPAAQAPMTAKRADTAEQQQTQSASNASGPRTVRHRWTLWAVWVVASLVVITAAWYWQMISTRQSTLLKKVTLAVLPVKNLTGDSGREYVSDGMTEELIAQLGAMDPSRMDVIARTSAMAYKQSTKLVTQIGRELGVDYILEGSLRGDRDHIRFTAQLVRARDQTHVWVKNYDRTTRDVLALEDDIGRAVAEEIQLQLRPEIQGRRARALAVDPDSHQAYLLGRYHWNMGNHESLQKSINSYEQALAKDPMNALAYAGLADSYSALSDWYLPPRTVMPQAKAAAMKALELDDTSAAAHNSLCFIYMNYDWNWQAAEKECRRAIGLNPNLADAHDNYASLLSYLGRFAEMAAEIDRAERIDPLSFHIYGDGALDFFYARQYVLAVEQGQKSIDLAPNYFMSHINLALAYTKMGRLEEAVAEAEKGAELTDSPLVRALLAYTYAVAGQPERARRIVKGLIEQRDRRFICGFEIGTTYLALGELDHGFQWLEQAYNDRSFCIPTMKSDPRLDDVHSDSRYQSLIQRLAFPKP